MGNNEWYEQDRRKFWKDKYLKEHRIHFVISFVFSAGLVLLLRWRALVQISDIGWIAVFLIIIAWDLLHFNRQMAEYVRLHLAEEEEHGTARDGYSTIDPNDPRLVSTDESSIDDDAGNNNE